MKQYDAIIIGGGLGGLVTAAMLSKEGLHVCVLEQHKVIGGCLQSFEREGYVLDTGMHYIGSMSKGQVLYQYFKYLGIVDSLRMRKLDENGFDHFHFLDGTHYCHAMGYEHFIDNLAESFPNERANIEAISRRIKAVGNLISPSILKEGRISDSGMEYMCMSAYKEIANHIKDEKLRNVLAGNCGLFAGNRWKTSMYEYGMITYSNIESAYAFVGGSQQLADLLVRQIHANGGDVRLNTKVTKMILEDDKVASVMLASDEKVKAKWVISSLHPALTFSMLENNKVYKKAFFTRINSLENTYGLFTTYLLMKPNTWKYVNQNHYLFNNPDVWSVEGDFKGYNIPSTLFCMQPSADSEYTKLITLLTPMPFSQYERWMNTMVGKRGDEYVEFKENFSEAVIDFVSLYYPDLRNGIIKKYTVSPLTYRDYTGTPMGSAYGIVKDCQNPLVTLFPAKTRINNLLLTGQNLNIHGCLGTTISAAITCAEILGMSYMAKAIGNA